MKAHFIVKQAFRNITIQDFKCVLLYHDTNSDFLWFLLVVIKIILGKIMHHNNYSKFSISHQLNSKHQVNESIPFF